MKSFAALQVFLSVMLACHVSSENENILSNDANADTNLQLALTLVDNLSMAIFNTFQASVIAVKKHIQELGQEVNDDVIEPEIGIAEKPIPYIGKEVNEVAQNLKEVTDYINRVIERTIQKAEQIPPDALHMVGQTWNEIQFTANKLAGDIKRYRRYIVNKINTLKQEYGEESAEFHEAMKILYLEVENRCFFAIKRVAKTFSKALQLPQQNYFEINLPACFENWKNFSQPHPSAAIDEAITKARGLWNTIFNSVQVRLFLDMFHNLNLELWPCNALIWQDMTNVKDVFDRLLTKVEFYVNLSLKYIQKIDQEDAQEQLHRLNKEAKEIIDHLVDFIRIPYTKAYEVQTRYHCFGQVADEGRYDRAFQTLLAYLNQNGCKIYVHSQEFASITDRISLGRVAQNTMHRIYPINTNGDALHSGRMLHDYLRSLERSEYKSGIENQPTPEINIDVHAFLLHNHLIAEIISCSKNVLKELKACISKSDVYGKLMYLQFREEMQIFSECIEYMKLYVRQAVFYIDATYEPWSLAYIEALNNYEVDVKYRLNVLSSLLLQAFEFAIGFKNHVCEQRPTTGPIPQNGYPQETSVPAYDTPLSYLPTMANDLTYSSVNYRDEVTSSRTGELNTNDFTTENSQFTARSTSNGPSNIDALILPQTANPNRLTSPPPTTMTPPVFEVPLQTEKNSTVAVPLPPESYPQTQPPAPQTSEKTQTMANDLTYSSVNYRDEVTSSRTGELNTNDFTTENSQFTARSTSNGPSNIDALILPQTANPNRLTSPPPTTMTPPVFEVPLQTEKNSTVAVPLPPESYPQTQPPAPQTSEKTQTMVNDETYLSVDYHNEVMSWRNSEQNTNNFTTKNSLNEVDSINNRVIDVSESTNNNTQELAGKINEDIDDMPMPVEERLTDTQNSKNGEINFMPPLNANQLGGDFTIPSSPKTKYVNENINDMSNTEQKHPSFPTLDYPKMLYTSLPVTNFQTTNTPPPAKFPTLPDSPLPAPTPNEHGYGTSPLTSPTETATSTPRELNIANPPTSMETQTAVLTENSVYSNTYNKQTDTTVVTSNTPQQNEQPSVPLTFTLESSSRTSDDSTTYKTSGEMNDQLISTADTQSKEEITSLTDQVGDGEDVTVLSHTHSQTDRKNNKHILKDVHNDGDADVDLKTTEREMTDSESTVLKVTDDDPSDGDKSTKIVKETKTTSNYISTALSYFDEEAQTPPLGHSVALPPS